MNEPKESNFIVSLGAFIGLFLGLYLMLSPFF